MACIQPVDVKAKISQEQLVNLFVLYCLLNFRVSDSDDLSMSESEVGKLAVSIEKEMFNLYMNTDSRYKNKYRSLMFNLKDPKNKVCPSPIWST